MWPPFFTPNRILRPGSAARKVNAADLRGTVGEAVVRISTFVRIGAISGAFLLAGCASWSWDWVPSMSMGSANVSLTIESDPPGADARTSNGASCRTPCMIPVAADREFTVSYSLPGYLPQVIPVRPRVPETLQPDVEAGGALPAADLAPNPVYAQLQPAPPPPQTKKGRGRPPRPAPKQQ